MDPILDAMVAAAHAGGAVALQHFRRGVDVTLKADRVGGAQGRRFIVDPIDGTRNFARGIPYRAASSPRVSSTSP